MPDRVAVGIEEGEAVPVEVTVGKGVPRLEGEAVLAPVPDPVEVADGVTRAVPDFETVERAVGPPEGVDVATPDAVTLGDPDCVPVLEGVTAEDPVPDPVRVPVMEGEKVADGVEEAVTVGVAVTSPVPDRVPVWVDVRVAVLVGVGRPVRVVVAEAVTEAVVVLVTDRVAVEVPETVGLTEEVGGPVTVVEAVTVAVTVVVLEAVSEPVDKEVGMDAVEVAEVVDVIEEDPDEVGLAPIVRDPVGDTVPVPEILAVYEEVMVTVGDWVT